MKLKWLLVFGIIFLAILAPVKAANEILLSSEAVTNSISYNETARFVLTITNNQDTADRFLFSSTPSQLGSGTMWRFNPQVVDIAAHSSEDVIFDLTPPKDIRVGTYDLDLIVYSASDPDIRETETIRFYITKEYPHLSANIDLPSELYPGTIPINIIVENTGVDELDDLTAVFESDLFGAYDLEIGSLKSGETKLVFNDKVTIPTSTEVGTYDAKLTFYRDGEYVDELDYEITILGKGNLAVSKNIDKGILATKYFVKITNVGNVATEQEWTAKFPAWYKWFISAKPKQDSINSEGNTVIFSWPINLGTGESTIIYYEVSFAPLIALVLSVIFLSYVLAWYFRKEFSLSKNTRSKKECIEVKLTVKNNTADIQHNVVVEDKIPTPLKLVREFGTKTPTAIKKEGTAVRLIWKFRHLGPFEEIILTYGLKSRLGVVGPIRLPVAILKAKIGKRVKMFYSNPTTLHGKIAVKEKEEEA